MPYFRLLNVMYISILLRVCWWEALEGIAWWEIWLCTRAELGSGSNDSTRGGLIIKSQNLRLDDQRIWSEGSGKWSNPDLKNQGLSLDIVFRK